MEEFYGQVQPPDDCNDPEIIEQFGRDEEREQILNIIAPKRNYDGDWTVLLYNRLKDPKTKELHLKLKADFPTEENRARSYYDALSGHEKVSLEKPKDVPIDEYVESQTAYDRNLEDVFNSTKYGNALEFGRSPSNGGVSTGYGDTGAVFKDAVSNESNTKYTTRQKNIIEAHEKAHGIFDRLTNNEKKNILLPFNRLTIGYGFKKHADEVLARMSQLKNYFGFSGSEEFTIEHLNYAQENYIKDTGLDNNMSDFFKSIIDKEKFVELMNKTAC